MRDSTCLRLSTSWASGVGLVSEWTGIGRQERCLGGGGDGSLPSREGRPGILTSSRRAKWNLLLTNSRECRVRVAEQELGLFCSLGKLNLTVSWVLCKISRPALGISHARAGAGIALANRMCSALTANRLDPQRCPHHALYRASRRARNRRYTRGQHHRHLWYVPLCISSSGEKQERAKQHIVNLLGDALLEVLASSQSKMLVRLLGLRLEI